MGGSQAGERVLGQATFCSVRFDLSSRNPCRTMPRFDQFDIEARTAD